MNQEMKSLNKNKTWKLVNRPKDRKLVSCKWIYKLKPGLKGFEELIKARLIAKGFT